MAEVKVTHKDDAWELVNALKRLARPDDAGASRQAGAGNTSAPEGKGPRAAVSDTAGSLLVSAMVRNPGSNRAPNRKERRQRRRLGRRERLSTGLKHPMLSNEAVQNLLATKRETLLGMDAATSQAMKSLLNPESAYRFRLTVAPIASTISSNVVAGNTNFDPTGLTEWSGILNALFDEYRMDKLCVQFFPLIQSGSTALFFPAMISVASDFDSQVTPTAHLQVLTYSDSKAYRVALESASAYFVSDTHPGGFEHTSHIPRVVATAGVASAEWLDVGQSWPGGQMFYAGVVGTNGITMFHRVAFWYVSMRVRK